MHKLYSELIGLPVFDADTNQPINIVKDIIIDPENGKLIAFIVRGNRIIVPFDIEKISKGIFINDRSHIIPINEVLRVNEVSKMRVLIIGERVITNRNKINIGRVFDYEIDTTLMSLTKIHVAKSFLFFHFQKRDISYRNIVKINKNTIIVKNSNEVISKEKIRAKAQSTAFA